jgi:intracellular sulfur oxidation DsrE/DsrF family protein
MNRYLLIESRDPFESRDVAHMGELAVSLKRAGHEVELFLIGNGVLPARRGAKGGDLQRLAGAGVAVHADEFSLRERGVTGAALAPPVQPAPIERVIDRMEAGWAAIWH